MTTEVNLRRILDRKQWEMVTGPPVNAMAGCIVANCLDQSAYYFQGTTTPWLYDPTEDAWMQFPSPTITTVSTGAHHPHGPRGFPTAGTTTTITTNLTLSRVLKGFKLRIIAGPNAGTEAVIKTNTIGANGVITVETPFGTAITTASEFILLTGRLYVVGTGAVSAGLFKMYDTATNTWSNASITGFIATLSNTGRFISTAGPSFATGTATSATSTTLVNSAKTWTVNNWTNYQVRITGGTGAGQFRTISSNTATTLTVSSAWTTVPDATSIYAIEGNDDHLYYMGDGTIALYRYSISSATWTLLAPTTNRTGVPNSGLGGAWVSTVPDALWSDENNFLNGQWIYSFRASNSVTLDRYNIAFNTWESDITYSPKSDSILQGTGWACADGYIYIMLTTSGRLLKYNIAEFRMQPVSHLIIPSGTSSGDRMFDVLYTDGATKLRYLYYIPVAASTPITMFRMLIF